MIRQLYYKTTPVVMQSWLQLEVLLLLKVCLRSYSGLKNIEECVSLARIGRTVARISFRGSIIPKTGWGSTQGRSQGGGGAAPRNPEVDKST